MKFGISQPDLSYGLSCISRCVPTRSTGHPILSSVLFRLAGDTLSLTAFDLSRGMEVSFPVQGIEDGSVCLPGRLLDGIVSKIDGGNNYQIEIAVDGDHQCHLNTGGGKYSIRGLNPEEYPALPDLATDPFTLPAQAFRDGIRGTAWSASTDETKQVLTGVNITASEDCLEFAATDGHRLARARAGIESGSPYSVILPRNAMEDVSRILSNSEVEAISLAFDSAACELKWAVGLTTYRYTSRVLDGRYPNYDLLIPKDFETIIILDRGKLREALGRVELIANAKNHVVTFQVAAGQLALSCEAQDVGSGQELLHVQHSGPDITLAFNVRYVLDCLKNYAGEEVKISLNTPTSPVVFEPLGDDALYLCMPVEIRG